MHATLIGGLPGSGKSTLARVLAAAVPGAVVLDDPDSIEALDNLPPETPLVVITHPVFCRASARLRVEQELTRRYPAVELHWVFFENDPEACRANIRQRADGRAVDGYISALTRAYDIPEGADIRAVFGAKCPTARTSGMALGD